MAKFGCPPRFIATVRQFNDGMQTRVQNDGEFSEPLEVTNGVKQDCVMAPTLFTMMFSAMLISWMLFRTVTLVFQSGTVLMAIYSTLKTKTKLQTDVLDELLYAGDMDKNASSETKMQRAMDQVSQSCDNYDLTISTKRHRLYINQHLENRTTNHHVNGQKLKDCKRKCGIRKTPCKCLGAKWNQALTPS